MRLWEPVREIGCLSAWQRGIVDSRDEGPSGPGAHIQPVPEAMPWEGTKAPVSVPAPQNLLTGSSPSLLQSTLCFLICIHLLSEPQALPLQGAQCHSHSRQPSHRGCGLPDSQGTAIKLEGAQSPASPLSPKESQPGFFSSQEIRIIKHLLCARFIYLFLTSPRQFFKLPLYHFIEEKTEVQRGEVTWLRSHRKWEWNPGPVGFLPTQLGCGDGKGGPGPLFLIPGDSLFA